jgi:hypothetical protein
MKVLYKLIALNVLIIVFSILSASAQQTTVSGTVIDAATKETIPYASFVISGSGKGGRTDIEGKYQISFSGSFTELKFTYIGYKSLTRILKIGQMQVVNVSLQ